MGKPGEAVIHSFRNACRPAAGRGARLGAMSPRSNISFPVRSRSPADAGVISYSAAIACSLKNRAVYRTPGARPTELPDDRTCGLHSAFVRALVVGMET